MAGKMFQGDMKSVIWLVFTKTEGQFLLAHPAGTKYQKDWLEQSKTDSNFQKIYELVDCKPERCLFVDNKNPKTAGTLLEQKKARLDNVKMAERILTPVHNSLAVPVVLQSAQIAQ